MDRNYEDGESCYAFHLLFNQIKVLQKSETTLKHQNTTSLEKCHMEIKNLFEATINYTEEEENTAKVS